MHDPLILTLDIGTSSTRASLFDAQARMTSGLSVQLPNMHETSADGGSEFDMTILLETVAEAVDRLLELAGMQSQRIAAVAMDTFVISMVGVETGGMPLTPLYTYADVRSAEDAEKLRFELGVDGIAAAHERTGCLVHTAYFPPRLLWMARTQPRLMDKVDYWMTVGDFLLWTFTGRRVISYSVASWTGMLNRRELTWDQAWLASLPIDESQLSTLVDVDQPVHGLRKEWAERWPALASVPWLPAVGDGAAANIGSGCDAPTEIALTVGTTAAMRVVVDPTAPSVPDGLWLYRVDRQRGLLGGATTEGGNLFAWFRSTLQLPPAAELERALADREPAAHGITVLPFIGGERAPGWKEDALATFSGISLHTDAVDLVRAGLEAISYRFAIIYSRLQPNLPHDRSHRIVASGGALLSSPTWLQIMADVLGQPVIALAEQELTARGTTLLALEALGSIDRASDVAPATGRVYEPDAQRHARHEEALKHQLALYECLYG